MRTTPAGWHWHWMSAGAFLLGCGGNVVVDGDAGVGAGGGSGSAGGATVTALVTTTFDPNGPCAMNADLNPPGAEFVLIASQPISCAETLPSAFSSMGPCSGAPFVWEVCLALPPSSLAVGTVLLTNPAVNAEEQDVGGCGQDCCQSSTILDEQGALQIAALSASSVTFALGGTATNLSPNGQVEANGTYTAPLCP